MNSFEQVRRRAMSRVACLIALCLGGAVLVAAPYSSAQKTDMPPKVLVAKPVVQEVTDYEEFKGRVAANAVVKITPRVSGYVARVLFKDGEAVKKGEVLFELDARVQELQVKAAKAEVALASAHQDFAKADLAR